MTTNICFGGDDLRTAYVTLSSTGRAGVVPLAPPRPPPRPPIASPPASRSQPTGQIVVCVGIFEERPSEILTQTGMDGVEIAWLTMVAAVLHRDARLPEERGRLRQAGRHVARRRHGGDRRRGRSPTSSSSTPARSSTRPAGSRSTRSSRSTNCAWTASRLVVTGCMAERYGDELAAELPEVDQVAGFGQSFTASAGATSTAAAAGRKLIPVSSTAIPTFDLLNLPRPKSAVPWAYVKIAEGLRPVVRILRDPEFPRAAAQPRRRLDPRRGRAARGARDRARRAGPGVVRQGPPGRARRRIDRARSSRPSPRSTDRVRLLYLYPSDLHRRADRRDLRVRCAVLRPVAPAREQAAAAPDAPVG